jgi:SulP family sulfate permease
VVARVGRDTLRVDAIAGLTGAMVLVSQAVAFATIAGMLPEFGLYAAVLPAIAAARGSSWHLVWARRLRSRSSCRDDLAAEPPSSPAFVSLVLTLTLLRARSSSCSLLRLGTLSTSSRTPLSSPHNGAAVLIATSQFRNFFGIDGCGASVWP